MLVVGVCLCLCACVCCVYVCICHHCIFGDDDLYLDQAECRRLHCLHLVILAMMSMVGELKNERTRESKWRVFVVVC